MSTNTIYEMWKSGTLTKEYVDALIAEKLKKAFGDHTFDEYLPPNLVVKEWAVTGSTMLSILLNENWGSSDIDIVCTVDTPYKSVAEYYAVLRNKISRHADGIWSDIEYYPGINFTPTVRMYKSLDETGTRSRRLADIMLTTDPIEKFVSSFDLNICASFCGNRRCMIADPELTFQRKTHGIVRRGERRIKYTQRGVKLLDYPPMVWVATEISPPKDSPEDVEMRKFETMMKNVTLDPSKEDTQGSTSADVEEDSGVRVEPVFHEIF